MCFKICEQYDHDYSDLTSEDCIQKFRTCYDSKFWHLKDPFLCQCHECYFHIIENASFDDICVGHCPIKIFQENEIAILKKTLRNLLTIIENMYHQNTQRVGFVIMFRLQYANFWYLLSHPLHCRVVYDKLVEHSVHKYCLIAIFSKAMIELHRKKQCASLANILRNELIFSELYRKKQCNYFVYTILEELVAKSCHPSRLYNWILDEDDKTFLSSMLV
jgi:hypothetical protein